MMEQYKIDEGLKKIKDQDDKSRYEREFMEMSEILSIGYYSMKSSLYTSLSFNYYVWKLFENMKSSPAINLP